LGRVAVGRIRFEDNGWDDYLVRFRVGDRKLIASVRQSGVVEPIVVEEWKGGYRVISGFARAAAAREAGIAELAALIYGEGALSAKEAYLIAVAANAPGSTLSDADRAIAIVRGAETAGLGEERLAREVLPLLGLPASWKVVREFLAIGRLPRVILAALTEGEISREHAEALLLLQADEKEWFFAEGVKALRLSAGDTRVVVEAALDIAAREGRTAREVFSEALGIAGKEAPAGNADEAGAVRRKKARVKEILFRRMRPVLAEMEDAFREIVREISLPAGAEIRHSENFETDEIEIAVKAKDAEVFEKLKSAIERGMATGAFERMMSIAHRKAEERSGRRRHADKGD